LYRDNISELLKPLLLNFVKFWFTSCGHTCYDIKESSTLSDLMFGLEIIENIHNDIEKLKKAVEDIYQKIIDLSDQINDLEKFLNKS
jgi:hypothetical protein